MNYKKLLWAAALAGLPFTHSFAQPPGLSDIGRESQPIQPDQAAVAKYGRIVGKQPLSVGGLTAWTVEKGGKQVVLYTTPPGQRMAVIAGVVWDPMTGGDVSAIPAKPSAPETIAPQTPSQAAPGAAMSGSFSGEIPPAMMTVDSLQGVKEGQGGVGDTVYIVIDPRCPYCQQAYALTRPYVAKGHTIKWIPTTALGDKANGVPIAATILQSTDPAVLARVLGNHEQIRSEPTPDTVKALDLNLAFMFAAFEQNQQEGQRAGVPVAFYIDHRTGRPKMMTGLTDQAVLQDIFGSL